MATHQKKHKKNNLKYENKEFILKTNNNEEYGKVIKNLGCGRFEVKLLSNNNLISNTVQAILKSNINGRKKVFIKPNNFVLIDINNTFTKTQYYIIYVYNDTEKQKLIDNNHIQDMDTNDINGLENNILFQNDINNLDDQDVEIDDDFIANI
jgi:translation initiation factor IF-1